MIKYCWCYIKQFKLNLIIYILASLLQTGLTIYISLIIGNILDVITIKRDINLLISLCVEYAILQLLILGNQYIIYYQMIVIQTNAAFELNKELINHTQKLSLSNVEKIDAGYLSQRINSDSNTIISFTLNMLVNFPCNIILVFVTFFFLIQINISIGIILTIISLSYILLYMLFKQKIQDTVLIIKEKQNLFFSVLLKQIEKIYFLKIQSLYQEFDYELKREYNNFFSCIKKNQLFLYVYRSLYTAIVAFAQVAIYFIGGMYVLKGKISIGSMSIIISLFQKALNSATYFSDFVNQYQDSYTSYSRILEIIKQKQQSNGKKKLETLNEVKCNNITLRRSGHKVLSDFSYEFKKGYMYAITGNNGSGKTSLIELLIGIFNDEFEGELMINGFKWQDIDFEQLRMKNISFMEQKPELYSSNLDKNIFLTKFHCQQNLKKVLDLINYSSPIFNWGDQMKDSGLSGGETQKVALYRTFAKDADLYIFDEGNSALDKSNKKLFMQALEYLKKENLVLVVSHEKEVIDLCDFVIKLS